MLLVLRVEIDRRDGQPHLTLIIYTFNFMSFPLCLRTNMYTTKHILISNKKQRVITKKFTFVIRVFLWFEKKK